MKLLIYLTFKSWGWLFNAGWSNQEFISIDKIINRQGLSIINNVKMVFCVFRVSFSQGEKKEEKVIFQIALYTIFFFCPLWTMSTHRENVPLRGLTQKCGLRRISLWFKTLVIKYMCNIYCVPVPVLGVGKQLGKTVSQLTILVYNYCMHRL